MTRLERWIWRVMVGGGVCAATMVLSVALGTDPPGALDVPVYSDGDLLLPADYREWVFLSAGVGIVHGDGGAGGRPRLFTNVFAAPRAHRHFLQSGTWPDETILVLEIRGAAPEGAVNAGGHHQTAILATQVAVKDRRRFPDGWGYFTFGVDDLAAPALSAAAGCQRCHAEQASVDQTFVQFYPTLWEAARRHGRPASPPPTSETIR